MRLMRTSFVVFVALACAQGLSAQGLAAAAEKEKERRAQQKDAGSTKSYGSEQLGSVGTVANDTSVAPAAAGGAAGKRDTAGSTAPATASSASGQRGESYWRSRAQQLRAAVAAAEARLKDAEKASAGAGPIPYGDYKVPCQKGQLVQSDGSLGPVVNPCSSTGSDYQRSVAAKSQLEWARQSLEQARQALASFEEEARRAGALPGWIR